MCCDVTLALIFYVLLKPVHRYVSLFAAFFGLMGTATFAAAELFYFAPTLFIGSMRERIVWRRHSPRKAPPPQLSL